MYTHLDEVYRERAKYCVLFASGHYAKKLWTSHERKSAQARAFQENAEYILPAKFDDSPIPGLLPTVGYIDLRRTSPEDLAALIIEKLGTHPTALSEYPEVEVKVGTPWSQLANEPEGFEVIKFRGKLLGTSDHHDLNGATTLSLYQLQDGKYVVYKQQNVRGDYGVATLFGANYWDDDDPPMTLQQLQERFPALASSCGLPRIRTL